MSCSQVSVWFYPGIIMSFTPVEPLCTVRTGHSIFTELGTMAEAKGCDLPAMASPLSPTSHHSPGMGNLSTCKARILTLFYMEDCLAAISVNNKPSGEDNE